MFFNIFMIIPLQDIMVNWRPFTKFTITITCLDFPTSSKTTANCALPVLTPSLCTTDLNRLFKQLPIPKKPWNSISMDFIEKLPPSSSYTSILVIVDCLSKQLLFIQTHNTSCLCNLHNSLFFTSSPSMMSLAMSLLTAAWNSSCIFSTPSEWHWTSSFTSHQDIILKAMDKTEQTN